MSDRELLLRLAKVMQDLTTAMYEYVTLGDDEKIVGLKKELFSIIAELEAEAPAPERDESEPVAWGVLWRGEGGGLGETVYKSQKLAEDKTAVVRLVGGYPEVVPLYRHPAPLGEGEPTEEQCYAAYRIVHPTFAMGPRYDYALQWLHAWRKALGEGR